MFRAHAHFVFVRCVLKYKRSKMTERQGESNVLVSGSSHVTNRNLKTTTYQFKNGGNHMKRKILALCLSIALILSIGMVVASASTPKDPYQDTTISSHQSAAVSYGVAGTYKVFGGSNYNTSQHNLTISSQYFSGSSGWKFDKKIRVSIGSTLDDTNTTFFSDSLNWRVHLAPYAVFTSGCNGWGYIYYDM